jgi:hypothetical protein
MGQATVTRHGAALGRRNRRALPLNASAECRSVSAERVKAAAEVLDARVDEKHQFMQAVGEATRGRNNAGVIELRTSHWLIGKAT